MSKVELLQEEETIYVTLMTPEEATFRNAVLLQSSEITGVTLSIVWGEQGELKGTTIVHDPETFSIYSKIVNPILSARVEYKSPYVEKQKHTRKSKQLP